MKKYLSFLKHSLIASIVFSLFVLGGCSDDDKESNPVFEGTVWELITSDKYKQAEGAPAAEALDSLVKYLELNNLDGLFQSATPYTLFAPSNQAFIALTATPGFPADITTISPDIIAGVLAYHVTPGSVLSNDLETGVEYPTLFAQPDPCGGASDPQFIEVNANGTLLTGSTNDEIEIVLADRKAENGAVHITESVLIPPSVGATLTPILTTLAATVLLSADFEIVAGLVTFADCGITGTTTTPLVNILANPAGDMTAFLPPDAVFSGGGLGDDITEVLTSLAGLGVDTPAEVRGVLLNHIYLGGSLNATEVTAAVGTSLTMASGASYAITSGPLRIGGKPVVVPNADTRDNGIAHAIGGILGF